MFDNPLATADTPTPVAEEDATPEPEPEPEPEPQPQPASHTFTCGSKDVDCTACVSGIIACTAFISSGLKTACMLDKDADKASGPPFVVIVITFWPDILAFMGVACF